MVLSRSTRILHVDDDPGFADLVEHMLADQRDSFEVRSETDPTAVLDYLDTEQVDCIVSDYEMPRMDGLELLETVRDTDPELPFILFTGKGTEAVASRAISAGVTDYIQKEGGTDQFAVLANRIENAVDQREYERQFATFIDNLPGIVYRTRNTPEWETAFARGEVEEITGYDWRRLETNEITWGDDIIHPDDQNRIWETVQESLDAEGSFEFTYRILTQGGEQKWVWERGEQVDVSETGTAVFEGVIVDVTDLKTSKQQLERERERFSRLFENFPEPTISYHLDDDDHPIVTSINEAFEEMFGYTSEEIVGESINDYIVPSDRMEKAREMDRQTKERVKVNEDVLRETVDGERYFNFRDIPVPSDENITGFAVYSDIHEHKTREAELERYERFLDNLPDLVIVMNESGVVEYQSAVQEEILEFEPRDLVGKSPDEHIHPDDVEAVNAEFAYLVDNPGETLVTEFRAEDSSGEWRWYESRSRNYLETEPIDGILMSIRDITDRKEKEQELARQKERLDEFASVVSHDLRNPLNVATLRTDLAASECDSEHLEPVQRSLERMEDLVGTLLTLAREGDTVGEPEPVELADVVTRCWENVETANGTIDCETDAVIHADADRVASLLENLFRNAVEHSSTSHADADASADAVEHSSTSPDSQTRQDAVEHSSTSHADAESGVTITVGDCDGDGFYVADDGPGIPVADREAVFESGYSTSENGTGLGLTIVYEIVEAHDWEIRVTESEAGGARFEITGVEFVD